MRTRNVVLGSFLLGTSALVSPAQAQIFDNQVNATALISTNTGNVYATGQFGPAQSIATGIGNNIGASATGALGIASVNQTVSQSTVQQGVAVMPGNQVVVGTISATNNTPILPFPPVQPGDPVANIEASVELPGLTFIGTTVLNQPQLTITGGGISNSIGASATGAAATANIVQSFDNNTGIDLTTLASNRVRAGDISATNEAGSVRATMHSFSVYLGGGIGNSVSAQAVGASAGASIASRMLDTTNTLNPLLPPGVATNVVRADAISAINKGPVTAIFGVSNFALGGPQFTTSARIFNGNGNSIGAFATGASAAAGINQAIGSTAFVFPQGGGGPILNGVYSNTVNVGPLTARNTSTGAVTAILGASQGLQPAPAPLFPPVPIGDTNISFGIGNAIAAQATGASAGGSIVQRYDNLAVMGVGGLPAATAATNRLVTGDMLAVNRGTVTALGATTGAQQTGPGALISDGIGNLIGTSAVGASTNLSIVQAVSGSTIIAGAPNDNTARLNGGMTARNGAGAVVQSALTQYAPTQIAGGVGNSIGASAVGASASATINESILGGPPPILNATDVASLGSNTVIVNDTANGGHALRAVTNATSAVTASYTQQAVPAQQQLQTFGTIINNGMANSITASAAGAAVNAGITARYHNISTGAGGILPLQENRVNTTAGTTTDLFARNNGSVTATFTTLNGSGEVAIVTGVANSVGASAAGASASANITQSASSSIGFVDFGPIPPSQIVPQTLTANVVRTGDIEARNNGPVTSTLNAAHSVNIGPFTPQFGGPPLAGIGHSIAAQSVGAAAGASISSRFYQVVPNPAAGDQTLSTNTVRAGDVTAVSNLIPGLGGPGSITATAAFGPFAGAFINGGIGNFIGASATGASASAAIVQSVSQAFTGLNFDLGLLPANSVTAGAVSATNSATVRAVLTMQDGGPRIGIAVQTPDLIDDARNSVNVGNSIAAQAVGASAGASITAQVFNTAIAPATLPFKPTNSVQVASLTSTNSGPVTAAMTISAPNFGFNAPSINGGIGNSIGASATGAASVASINQTVSFSTGSAAQQPAAISTLNTLPANSISSGPITAINSGNITASLNTIGGSSFGPSILGGVGNSISANAVGASAGASIVQSIAHVR